MNSELKKTRASLADYLSYEQSITGKAEFYDGEIFDMAGGSELHSLLAANFSGVLFGLLKGKPCRVYNSDFRVALDEADSYVYPDLMVICGATQPSTRMPDSATNPVLVVEVLSESTALHDRSFKFNKYRTLDSLQEYVLVTQTEAMVEVYTRAQDDSWTYRAFEGLDAELKLRSLDVTMHMADLYANFSFAAV